MQKSIFITGTSSGLGKATALLFQSKGWTVIATMRHPEKEEELGQLENVTLLSLDVTNTLQIEDTVKQVSSAQPIDVVQNNAGYGLIGSLEDFRDGQVNDQINTNLLGIINITRAFIPGFRKIRSGLFINITRTLRIAQFSNLYGLYATKFAIDGFSEGLAHELAQFSIQVKVVSPGGMQTDFAGRSMHGAMHPAYEMMVEKVSEDYSAEQVVNYTKQKK